MGKVDAMLDEKVATTLRLPTMFAEPLGDLRLDKSIDAEVASVYAQLGRKMPSCIEGQQELESILEALCEKGYDFQDEGKEVCRKIWAFCSSTRRRVTTKQFRSWFHGRIVSNKGNLRALLSSSRWVHRMVLRINDDPSKSLDVHELCEVVKSIHHHLGQPVPCDVDVKAVVLETFPFRKCSGCLSLSEFMQVLVELLVRMYFEYFNRSSKTSGLAPLHKKSSSFTYHLPCAEVSVKAWKHMDESLSLAMPRVQHAVSATAA